MAEDTPYLGRMAGLALLIPMALLLVVFFVWPLAQTIWQSIHDGTYTLRAYRDLFSSSLFLKVLQNTFAISATATLVSLLAGYPVALHLSRLDPARRVPYLVMVMLPFWTSVLVKSFALTVLLGYDGVINNLLSWIWAAPVVTVRSNRSAAV